MSAPAIAWMVVCLATTIALLACFAGLFRHVLLLYRTLQKFQEEVRPVAEEITAGGDRAASRTGRR